MICLDGHFLLEGPNVIFTDLTLPCTFLDHRETRSVSCEKANGIKNCESDHTWEDSCQGGLR